MIDPRFGRNAGRNPYVSSHNCASTDNCVSSKDCCICVNHYISFYRWMAFFVRKCFIYAKGTEGHALINFYILFDDRSFSNHYSCSVVDNKRWADCCTWVDIYAGNTVSAFSDEAWNYRNLPVEEPIGNSIHRNRVEARIRRDYLVHTSSCRVSTINSLCI